MSDYRIITDSTADLSPKLIEELDITVIPMTFILGGKEYKNYPDEHDISNKNFYANLRDGKTSTTNQITTVQFERNSSNPFCNRDWMSFTSVFPPGSAELLILPCWQWRSCKKNTPTAKSYQ